MYRSAGEEIFDGCERGLGVAERKGAVLGAASEFLQDHAESLVWERPSEFLDVVSPFREFVQGFVELDGIAEGRGYPYAEVFVGFGGAFKGE